MGLREIKRTSGSLHQSPAYGEWAVYGVGELARCPVPDCNTGLQQAGYGSQVRVRVALEGIGEDDPPSSFTLCPDTRCKTRLQIKIELEGTSERFPNSSGVLRSI